MGCGESKSKHDVATGNTVLKHKKSNVKYEKIDDETIQENSTNDNNNNIININNDINNNVTPDDVVVIDSTNGADLKDIEENTKLEQEKIDDGGDDDVEKHEVQNLITKDSPNNFISSRKNDEDGPSENSEYNTPRHGAGAKEDLLSENEKEDDDDDVVEEKELVAEETKAGNEDEYIVNVKKEGTIDTNVISTSTGEENMKADHNEEQSRSPSEEVKTN
ncbi:hypothetical protein O6P43_021702 [Quillaja saponaria]|uniref:Uncharacterized protein n=1 Tax=Quillaja saponaria TaxID=32244 RepID=A0AAD7PHJ9_QUISA|nr:hypothetical protein O6P43_021702 [Quillaja saponaria]